MSKASFANPDENMTISIYEKPLVSCRVSISYCISNLLYYDQDYRNTFFSLFLFWLFTYFYFGAIMNIIRTNFAPSNSFNTGVSFQHCFLIFICLWTALPFADISLRGHLMVYDNVNHKIGWAQSDCVKPHSFNSLPSFGGMDLPSWRHYNFSLVNIDISSCFWEPSVSCIMWCLYRFCFGGNVVASVTDAVWARNLIFSTVCTLIHSHIRNRLVV